MAEKMDAQSAKKELERIYEVLGIDSDDGSLLDSCGPALLRAIQEGRLMAYDDDSVSYVLRRPIRSESGEIALSEMKLREPTASEIVRATKGMKVSVNGAQGQVDMSDATRKTINILSAISGVSIGILDRMRAGDLDLLTKIVNFFG